MSASFCPRLSQATHLLPLLRAHLAAVASRLPLSGVIALDLLPIVEDGVFGYELVPAPRPRFCLTLGCNEKSAPVLRKTFYGGGEASSLRLAALHGETVRRNAAAAHRTRRRESTYSDWPAAVESAWAQLATPFADRPRRHICLDEKQHGLLDQALSIAHSHLAAWDPCIRFWGLPDEAQHGFALYDARGNRGELVSRQPNLWVLRWKAPPRAVHEEWSAALPDPARGSARATTSLSGAG